jgi:hypothetical protein
MMEANNAPCRLDITFEHVVIFIVSQYKKFSTVKPKPQHLLSDFLTPSYCTTQQLGHVQCGSAGGGGGVVAGTSEIGF